MKISVSTLRLLHCLHLPGVLLIALLQRTPAVRVIASAGEFVLRHPIGSLLKSTVSTLGALGAVHTLAGATTLSPSTPSPAAATVGTAKTIVFAVIGAQSAGESWTVGGSVPPGMSFNGGATSGTVNTPTGILTLSGTPITGGTYVLSLRAWEKAGAKGESSPVYSYTVIVSGGAGGTAPAFTAHPASQTVTAGANVTLTVTATGSPTPTLQWQKNGGAIAGQTGPSLILSSVTTGDAGSYTCVATNASGSVTSNAATLTVNAAAVMPSFTTHPASQTVTAGANVTFTATATGSPTPTLQWQKNGSPLAGQTGPSLTLSNVQAADAGSYTCVATNASGPVTSNAATLTVNAAAAMPSFTAHPASQTVAPGANVTFTATATGSPTPTLQWQKNGSPLAGQTGPSLTLSNVQAADAGSYTCVATNASGSVTSNSAALTVTAATAAPAFTTQPASQTVNAGTTVTFTVAVSGSPTPTLQWRKNGSALAGQTGSSLTLANVQSADEGAYTCVATNSVSVATSATANLTVSATPSPNTAPVFSLHPGSATLTTGGTLNLTVAVSGTPTPSLQWLRNGTALAGKTGPTLTISNVQPADAGSYTCVATNAVAAVTSNAANVTVSSDTGSGSRISNVSVRTTLAAAQTLIVGFTMQGGSKLVVVRAVGPGLANFGVAGTMSDPRLLLYKDAAMLTQNDNWGGSNSLTNVFAAVGAFPLTVTSLDAALMRTVEGGHTAQVTGPSGGNVLVEAYDAGTGASPRLTNISARNFVGTGGDILIAGFTIAGSGNKNLLIRAVGPTLGAFGVAGTLVDPKLAVYNAAGAVIAENDSWGASLASTFASVGAFPLTAGSKDAAFTLSLPPGGYTVQVSGGDGGTGEALVEVYELP
ncbi:MAG: immunoglobulin domain-containing protein [Opitutaceae bacterium]|nr:immunoglobulin domain-containing protein [Opitutaceae bacterium]